MRFVSPISLTDASYDLTMYLIIPATLLGVSICLAMVWTGFKFSRWEGSISISFYVLFLGPHHIEAIGTQSTVLLMLNGFVEYHGRLPTRRNARDAS